MRLEALRCALRGGLWPLAAELLGVHVLALAVRGNAWEIDLLLTAVPRDVLLSHPELAAALAIARIMQGPPPDRSDLTAAALAGVDRLPGPRAERLRVLLDLMEFGNGRARGDLLAVAAASRRIPRDPVVLAELGLTGWDLVSLLVLGNGGIAEFWTGDRVAAEKHLRAAVDFNRLANTLRSHPRSAGPCGTENRMDHPEGWLACLPPLHAADRSAQVLAEPMREPAPRIPGHRRGEVLLRAVLLSVIT